MKNYKKIKKIGMLLQSSPRRWDKMMRKSATAFTTNFRVKKRHFHYKYAKKKIKIVLFEGNKIHSIHR
jgi:hypothetical protein